VESEQTNEARCADPIRDEITKSTIRFFKEYAEGQIEPSSVKGKFPLIIDKTKFFGEPMIAKVASIADEAFDYYLVVMHFNIPPLNPALGPIKYSFARFESKFVLYTGDSAETGVALSNADAMKMRATHLEPVKILAVYPVNESLDVDRTDDSKFTIEPEYAGTSGGSATQEWDREEKYKLSLPTVISTATKYGDAA
jgi:hypothetical protein